MFEGAVDEKLLMEEAGKQLRPIVVNALSLFEEILKGLRNETEIEIHITFKKKGET